MQTPATGFRRALPETLGALRKELEAARDRKLEELIALQSDLAWVAAVEGVALGEHATAGLRLDSATLEEAA
jgi:hypothetical protein